MPLRGSAAVDSIGHALLQPSDYRVMPWKNGGGTTREIAVYPDAGDLADPSFLWRVSMADIVQSGAFSRFSGYDRTLILMNGRGLLLQCDGEPAVTLDAPYQRLDFAGECATHCTLTHGPVRDLNVMVARGAASALTAVLRPGPQPVEHAVDGQTVLLHCAEGSITVAARGHDIWDIGEGETLRLDGGDHAPASVLLRSSGAIPATGAATTIITLRIAVQQDAQGRPTATRSGPAGRA
ncbi:MAG: HutD family protein [Betaproteobacteria bacterium]